MKTKISERCATPDVARAARGATPTRDRGAIARIQRLARVAARLARTKRATTREGERQGE